MNAAGSKAMSCMGRLGGGKKPTCERRVAARSNNCSADATCILTTTTIYLSISTTAFRLYCDTISYDE